MIAPQLHFAAPKLIVVLLGESGRSVCTVDTNGLEQFDDVASATQRIQGLQYALEYRTGCSKEQTDNQLVTCPGFRNALRDDKQRVLYICVEQ